MSENQPPRYRTSRTPRPRPQSDIMPPPKKKVPAPAKPKKKDADFPAIGMTLNSYQSSTDGSVPTMNKRPVKEAGRFARLRQKITVKRVVLILLALLLLSGGWLGFKFFYNANKLFGGSVFSAFSNAKLKGESDGRVNILLAGNSADDPGHQGGNLTDSIMILSIDTKNNTGFMLSVPRDLYVAIPGNGHQKINAVYPAGEKAKFSENGYPEGGMGLLEKVLHRDFGVNFQYYALVNYNALREAVNSVGGVDITVASSDKRGLYDPSKDYTTNGPLVRLTNGVHHLNGQEALNLSRARGDARGSYGFANSDFDRTAHQQQLILALRTKASTAGVLANPIKLGKLFDAAGSNVQTDLSLSNVRRLYDITKTIPSNGIQSLSLNNVDGKNYLKNYRTPRGESALVPATGPDDYSDIKQFITKITSTDLRVREGAKVVLLNGTATRGLASHESYELGKKNYDVAGVGDADNQNYTVTQIIDVRSGKMPATKKALLKEFTGSTSTTVNPFGNKYDADFIIILGTDVATKAAAED